jgi:TPR repeat protein
MRQDWKQASEWFKVAGDAGHAEALHCLAMLVDSGHHRGLANHPNKSNNNSSADDADHKLAVHYWTLSSEQGFALAQYNLALCYHHGMLLLYRTILA